LINTINTERGTKHLNNAPSTDFIHALSYRIWQWERNNIRFWGKRLIEKNRTGLLSGAQKNVCCFQHA